jgi:hypothetical protein
MEQPLSIAASQWTNWRTYKNCDPTWFYSALGLSVLAIICLVAGSIDDRLYNGVSVWSKPFKFALSLSVYIATLMFFVRYLPTQYLRAGAGLWLANSITATMMLEMAYIAIQASLGEASHFNITTPFHSMMYSLMGIGAAWLVIAPLWLAWIIWRNNKKRDVMAFSIVIGLALTFGLGGGFGGYLGNQTSHWVGAAATDADGLWLFNWATNGGDLRVAHFFGMHAMQVVPLFALLLPQRLRANTAYALVIGFSAAYATFSVHTFVQAIEGQPFIS